MTTFLEKTTLFSNFAHKMQSGGIFFARKLSVYSVLHKLAHTLQLAGVFLFFRNFSFFCQFSGHEI